MHHDGAGAVLRFDLLDVLFDDIVGFVPRDAFPLVFAAVFAGALHGIDDAVGMVHVLDQIEARGVQAPLVDRMLLVPLDLDEVALCVDRQLHAPSDRMLARRRPGAGPEDGGAIILNAFPFLFHRHNAPLASCAWNSPCNSNRASTFHSWTRRSIGSSGHRPYHDPYELSKARSYEAR